MGVARSPAGPVVAVVPARYASRRLPGKPLLKETGKYLLQHVYERARACPRLDRVIVATEDERIFQAARSFGAEVVMTSPHHSSGTDRVAEAVGDLECRIVVNVQGDEPDIDPGALASLVALLEEAPAGTEMATLAAPFGPGVDAALPNFVKVVVDRHRQALYFSRALIPHPDGGAPRALLHLGVYAYTKPFLLHLAALERTPLEQAEKLEQLRALEHGCRIQVGLVATPWPGGIDTPEDYAAFVRRNRGGAP